MSNHQALECKSHGLHYPSPQMTNRLNMLRRIPAVVRSTINQASLLPWLTSANSSPTTPTTGHNMAAMLFVPKNRQSQVGRKEGSAVGGQSALAAIY
ncbi:hypothetical protein PoB_006698000 [Plakobranchus ocellatus]|uniref:Uncharacterized protein n=1 Tax=Plakobranchus ocellatus TaxID=259542 RepID=A0AAV4D8T6_9GAST|nr:hypothetical protein PoB_006698000 [Plakobranchus ocellatus]